jgi:hypothetical protein
MTSQQEEQIRRRLRSADKSLAGAKDLAFAADDRGSMKLRSLMSAAKKNIEEAEHELAIMQGGVRVSPEAQAKAESYIRKQ